MTNVSVLVGRLTKDPELKYTQGGVAVTRFTLAVNRQFKNAQGEYEADFIQIVVWQKQAENVANFLKKGSQVSLQGRIQTGSFEGQDGKRVYTTEVVADNVQFLDPKPANAGAQNAPQQQTQQTQQTQQQQPQYQQQQQPQQQQQQYQQPQTVSNDPFQPGGGPIEVTDDDLPF